MIFEPPRRVPVPSSDILSYLFSDPPYDHDEPMYVDVHDPARSISYNQAHRLVRQLVAGLKAWGVQRGDCVVIHSFNDIYYPMLVLAIVGAGGVFTGTNPAYTPHELAHHFTASDARFVISEPEILPAIQKAMVEKHIPMENLRVFNAQSQPVPADLLSWEDLLAHGETDWVSFDDEKTASDTPAARLFSSGTTGLPKAATLTHRNLVAQHELAFEHNRRPYQISRVVPIPLFHAAAAPNTHFGSLKGGHVTYLMRRFDLPLFLETVEKYNVTELAVVPPVVLAILASPLAHSRPFLRSVRAAAVGAAPLDKVAQARFRALLAPGAPCTQVWGMTESSCIATLVPYPQTDDSGSVGVLIPNVEAKLVDNNDTNISAYNTPGEICLRGPTIIPGYYKDDAANAASFDADGWFHTGDIGYCDAASHRWYIIDRKKELIKVRGFQVAPPELEGVLRTHPGIVDAAVVGVGGGDLGSERPRAYVVCRAGVTLGEQEVRAFMEPRLAKYKALTGGVRFVQEIPRNASGKILKRLLRERAASEGLSKL
ncbi:putative AMP-binding enzyme [Aspergillus campestris IBT 28561]|uniref:AMP-binding enzyme n=1 Tax=Aspergillus campestris (strain IBT 28561) TaxID=1392248 RepID=A0A2I1CQY1_ASPC2|nr:putative AMP-binding enzyme [Aspergillus campestris IBT 28561]PKY00040.1 putative AMP-binding enzyme [Aspergillus campestris IBT 28561]